MVQPIQSGLNMPRGASFAAANGTDADTIININHQETPQTTAPIIVQQTQPTYTPEITQPSYAPTPRMGGNIADVPKQTITMKPVTRTTVNWGAVVKGALIVTGIVVAGVVGWWALGAATQWALGTSLGGSIAALLEPVVVAAGNGLASLAGFLSGVPAIIGSFFSGVGSALGLTSAASFATTEAGVATVGAAKSIGLGAGLGLGTLTLADQFAHLDLTTQTQTHVATHTVDPTISTPHHDGLLSGLFSKKAAVMNHATDASMTPEVLDVPESSSSNLANTEAVRRSIDNAHAAHANHANHTAAELSHHAAHGSEHHTTGFHLPHFGHRHEDNTHADVGDNSAPDMPDEEPNPLQRRRNWRDRLTGASNYQQAYQSTGSHGAAIRASQSVGTPIQPRANDFTQALHDDRVKLEAALGDNNR